MPVTNKTRIDELLNKIGLPKEKVGGLLVLSIQDNAVIYSKDIESPQDKASMCLSLLSCSTLLAQTFNDTDIKLIRTRTENVEYFLISGEYIEAIRAYAQLTN